MAQHDYVIANGTGAAVRSDLNNALLAIVSQNSGATEPTTMYAYQLWADTSTGLLKIRNSANNAWITLRELDGTLTIEDGTVSSPGLAFRDDLNTGIFRPGTDQFAISTNGVERVEWGASEVVFNDGGVNYDFRIEGDNNANLLFVDASADAVGIGTSSPNASVRLEVNGNISSNGDASPGGAGITIGDNQSGGYKWIQSFESHPLVLNPLGNNVGIGTTSPSGANLVIDTESNSGSGIRLIGKSANDGSEIDFYADNNSTRLGYIEYNNSSTTFNSETNVPVRFFQNGGEAFRVDTSKRLLVGTSTTSKQTRVLVQGNSGGGATAEVVLAANTSTPSGGIGNIYFSDNGHNEAAIIAAVRDGGTWTSGSSHPASLQFYTTANGASSPTERMRISSNGKISFPAASASYLLNATSGGGGTTWQFGPSSTAIGSNGFFVYNGSGTGVYIGNGDTSWSSSSDERLKENLVPIENGLYKVSQLRAVTGRYVNDEPSASRAFLVAQDVQAVLPEAVNAENPDALGLRYTDVIPLLVAALKDAKERIEALEAEVAALKAS